MIKKKSTYIVVQVFFLKKVQVSVCGSGADLLNFLLCAANKTHFKYTFKKASECLERLDLRTTSSVRLNFPAKKKSQKRKVLKMFLKICLFVCLFQIIHKLFILIYFPWSLTS